MSFDDANVHVVLSPHVADCHVGHKVDRGRPHEEGGTSTVDWHIILNVAY